MMTQEDGNSVLLSTADNHSFMNNPKFMGISLGRGRSPEEAIGELAEQAKKIGARGVVGLRVAPTGSVSIFQHVQQERRGHLGATTGLPWIAYGTSITWE